MVSSTPTPTPPPSSPKREKQPTAEITEMATPGSSSSSSLKRKATHNPKRKQPTTKKLKKGRSESSPGITGRNRRRKIDKVIGNNNTNNEDHVESKPIKKRQTRKLQELKGKELDVSKASGERSSGNDICNYFSDLVMWKNVAKTTLWFGSGSVILLSSCFSRDVNFSIVSTASHLGILVLGMNFFRSSLPCHQPNSRERKLQLTEDDFLHVVRLALPVANAILAKCQDIFSGEPLMTLKVAPVLLFTAQYGHLITARRLFATGFFLSFTLLKFYTTYSGVIHKRVEKLASYVNEAWKSCPRKKLVATSAAMLFWNLFSVKTRMFAAFMSLAVFRYIKRSYWK